MRTATARFFVLFLTLVLLIVPMRFSLAAMTDTQMIADHTCCPSEKMKHDADHHDMSMMMEHAGKHCDNGQSCQDCTVCGHCSFAFLPSIVGINHSLPVLQQTGVISFHSIVPAVAQRPPQHS